MRFTKMHGAGNDYVYVDCFEENIPADPGALARAVSDRHTGIGADGLILICPPRDNSHDAEMRMFNVDGSPGEMCGNGIRCVGKYVYDHRIVGRETLRIASGGQVLELRLSTQGGLVRQVSVDMGEPRMRAEAIPTTLPGNPDFHNYIVNVPLPVTDPPLAVTCVSMGNPHCVTFVNQASDDIVLGLGPKMEVDPHFPKRVNVEFAEILNRNEVRQRTWERGSGETMACGTGASAVCVAGVLSGRTNRRITVHLTGGDLQLEWKEIDNHVTMTGPAAEVFSGEWEIRHA
jgi:diaminopimelate epimerase